MAFGPAGFEGLDVIIPEGYQDRTSSVGRRENTDEQLLMYPLNMQQHMDA